MSGIVYCLSNAAMPGYVKIGQTQDLIRRMKELDRSAVPLPFECEYAIEVDDPSTIETLLHDTFKDFKARPGTRREFFRLDSGRVASAMKLVLQTSGRDVTPREDVVEDLESQIALDEARIRRSAFNFEMVEIGPGSILELQEDPSVTCEVVNRKEVSFNGESMSVSTAACRALIPVRIKSGGVITPSMESDKIQGPIYWMYDGELLDDRRRRMEQGDY